MARVKKAGKSKGKPRASAPFSKAKKRRAVEQVVAAPKVAAQNPYDAFQNRKRHSVVLGERSVRGERRNVARSRAVSMQSRTTDLLREVSSMQRTSKFKDSRLSGGALEDGVHDVQRFVKVRQKQARKTFNLDTNAVEELTVGGKPLSGLRDEDLKATGDDASSGEEPQLGGGLDDVVARSKQRRSDEMRERKELDEKRGELDLGYADIMGELMFKTPKALAPLVEKDKPDGYDQLVKQLGTERKVAAADRTKTPEEIAREKAEKLEALERRRVARAEGIDLDDEAEADGVNLEAQKPPADEGESTDDGGSDEGGETGEEGSTQSDAEEAESVDEDDRQGEGCPRLLTVAEAGALDIFKNGHGEDGLPYAPDCPDTVEGVAALLDDRPPKTALKLVQRVRACTSPALGSDKRAKLKAFFVALLEYLLRAMVRDDGDLSVRGATVAYALRVPLVEFAVDHPEEAYSFFLPRLENMGKTRLPKAAEFCCLKLIALIFPVTDFHHPICTPAAVLLDHWASNVAKLGTGIEDLVSEATLLLEILYSFCSPARRFCAAFFRLGTAVLDSCWASAGGGRSQCLEASAAIAALLCKALRDLADAEPAVAATAARRLVGPTAERLAAAAKGESATSGSLGEKPNAGVVLGELERLCKDTATRGLKPLTLFETGPAKIKVLDPIFHEVGDRPQRGMEVSETKLLQRRLTKERRAASRQLARDAVTLQVLQGMQDSKRRVARLSERKRVRRIMEDEKAMLKQLGTETGGGMDTSLKRYSAKKEERVAKKRLGGNITTETRKDKDKVSKPARAAKAKKTKGKK